MTCMLCALYVLASSATAQHDDVSNADSYAAMMATQYAAQAPVAAQRPEEAQRIYDAYLQSIGQKSRNSSDNSAGNVGAQPR